MKADRLQGVEKEGSMGEYCIDYCRKRILSTREEEDVVIHRKVEVEMDMEKTSKRQEIKYDELVEKSVLITWEKPTTTFYKIRNINEEAILIHDAGSIKYIGRWAKIYNHGKINEIFAKKYKGNKKGIGDAYIIEIYTHLADDSCVTNEKIDMLAPEEKSSGKHGIICSHEGVFKSNISRENMNEKMCIQKNRPWQNNVFIQELQCNSHGKPHTGNLYHQACFSCCCWEHCCHHGCFDLADCYPDLHSSLPRSSLNQSPLKGVRIRHSSVRRAVEIVTDISKLRNTMMIRLDSFLQGMMSWRSMASRDLRYIEEEAILHDGVYTECEGKTDVEWGSQQMTCITIGSDGNDSEDGRFFGTLYDFVQDTYRVYDLHIIYETHELNLPFNPEICYTFGTGINIDVTIPWMEKKNGTPTKTMNTIGHAKSDIDANMNTVVLLCKDIDSTKEGSFLETMTGVEYITPCKEHIVYGEESVMMLKSSNGGWSTILPAIYSEIWNMSAMMVRGMFPESWRADLHITQGCQHLCFEKMNNKPNKKEERVYGNKLDLIFRGEPTTRHLRDKVTMNFRFCSHAQGIGWMAWFCPLDLKEERWEDKAIHVMVEEKYDIFLAKIKNKKVGVAISDESSFKDLEFMEMEAWEDGPWMDDGRFRFSQRERALKSEVKGEGVSLMCSLQEDLCEACNVGFLVYEERYPMMLFVTSDRKVGREEIEMSPDDVSEILITKYEGTEYIWDMVCAKEFLDEVKGHFKEVAQMTNIMENEFNNLLKFSNKSFNKYTLEFDSYWEMEPKEPQGFVKAHKWFIERCIDV